MKKAEKTRLKIIEQSAELFNRKGFAGTSVKDIMTETGLSKGGLYSHFAQGKEEIALAAFRHAVGVVYDAVGLRTHVIENSADKLKAVIHYYRENIFSPPVEGGCPIQNTSVDANDGNPKLKAEVVAALNDWQGRIIHTLNKGIENGEIRPDIDKEQFAVFYIGAIEGGILMARAHDDDKYFDIMAQQILAEIENISTGVSK